MSEEEKHILLAICTATAFLTLFGIVAMVAIARFTHHKQQILFEKKWLEAKFQRELLQVGMEMQENTFHTISQEIHDNVGQILSLAKLNLNILSLERKEMKEIGLIKELVSNAIQELRNLSHGYHADQLLDKGLMNAITYLVEQMSKSGLFHVAYTSNIEFVELGKDKTVFIYRIMQEISNNIIRHSGSSEVSFSIEHEKNIIQISMADNGKGFDTAAPDFQQGIGLKSIMQRAGMIGAELNIHSALGIGTTITLSLKINSHDTNCIS